MKFDMKAKPFYLNEDQSAWVDATYESLDLEERVGQLICAAASDLSENTIYNFTH